MFGQNLFKGKVPADARVRMGFNPECQYMADFPIDNILRQPKIGDDRARDAAQNRGGFKDVNIMAEQRRKIGAGQPCRSGTNNSQLFAGLLFPFDLINKIGVGMIGRESFESANGQSLIIFVAVTDMLAGMRADTSGNARKRIARSQKFQRFFNTIFLNQGMDLLNRIAGRTTVFTG